MAVLSLKTKPDVADLKISCDFATQRLCKPAFKSNRAMGTLAKLRSQIWACKVPAAGQSPREFLPEDSLDHILNPTVITSVLSDPAFQIPSHKRESTAQIVISEGRKVFAILVDLRLEYALGLLIENDCLDSGLPLNDDDLKDIPPEGAREILRKQWDYIAYKFRSGNYLRKIQNEIILPYLRETKIGGGGFSVVYEVFIHPVHQTILPCALPEGLRLVRKEIRVVHKGSSSNDEAELLFLLGSLRHRNIVELITSYSQNGLTNLLFPKADLDLHQFLLLRCRPSAFQDGATLFQSLHGLSSGLAYLHNFNPRLTTSEDPTTPTLYGYHHDIKPRNILVQGTDFVLADFGLSRVKTESEITQTSWKDSTYEYGAPECRDPNTFRPGMVGRALDIWSLACIFSEVMVYIEGGSQGIERFRDCRLLENVHGKTRCFHNNNALAPAVDFHLNNIERHSSSTAICTLGTVIRSMFASEPESRPKAKEVVEQMIHVTLESFTTTLLQTAEESYQVLNRSGVTNLFGTRLSLEKTRLEAWAAVLGLIPVQGSRRPHDKQTFHIFPEACSTLSSAIKELRDRPDFDDVHRDQDFIISSLHHTNNSIYGLLSRSLRLSVDGTFAILGTCTKSLESLQLIAPATKGNLSKSGDIAAISVMKYMSILLQQQDPGSLHGTRIESTLVNLDPSWVDPRMSPQLYWYSFGYLDTEKRRVLVEYKAFDTQWAKDPKATSFEELGKDVFSQIQGLVNMLQREPKPADFRVLKCLGAFPDIANCRFGFIYSYPHEDTTPIRLHSLLRRQRSQIAPPGLSERLALATVLVSSVHSFHVSGWLHKNINSYNILFFCQSPVPLVDGVDLNLENPYMVGFNYSRQDSPSAYTEGPVDTTFQDYQHPSYRNGGIRYEKYFDIYSLGLLLLEIGLWSSMGDISHMYPELSPLGLKGKYMRCCDSLDNMGRKYQAVTRTCLEADKWFNHDYESIDLRFQEEVVEKLRSCST